jgi:hypothetical protein
MATQFCDYCDKMIDLDWELEHFDWEGDETCVLQQEAEKKESNND